MGLFYHCFLKLFFILKNKRNKKVKKKRLLYIFILKNIEITNLEKNNNFLKDNQYFGEFFEFVIVVVYDAQITDKVNFPNFFWKTSNYFNKTKANDFTT